MIRYAKFLVKLILAIIDKSRRFIRLNPSLNGYIYFFDKVNKKFFKIFSREKVDSITADQIFTNHCYNLQFLRRYDELQKIYNSIVKSGKTPLIIDCGSNIGLSTIYFAELFPEAKIVSIEPEINNFNLMKKNCNKLKNVIFLNAAIGSEKGFVSIANSHGDNNSFRTVISKKLNSIELVLLNDIFIQNHTDVPFIVKIDIEGFENNLFEKNTSWVKKTPLIIIEPHDWMLPNAANFRNFLKVISSENRDFIIQGENVYSLLNVKKNINDSN
tara:strand:- start:190 stop:1005 length:816 start_codon:yes stop_codon:yes gene_type:complete